MCSVIGYYSRNTTLKERNILKSIFLQSGIRGKHATGLFCGNGYVSEPVSTYEFSELFPFEEIVGETYLIGHTRYSTSDLNFNQPIVIEGIAIVHNGVVTQENPSKWENHFGYMCETRNDSELLLRAYRSGVHPLVKFRDSSIACIVSDGSYLKFFRNEYRPLWFFASDGSYFISSTRDILVRAFRENGISISPIKCKPCIEYSITNGELIELGIIDSKADLQRSLDCTLRYKSLSYGLQS